MRQIVLILSLCLMAMLLSACGYQAGNFPPIHTDSAKAPADTSQTKTIVVNGKKYTCINQDGTWRCVELETLAKKLTGHGDLNAAEQNNKVGPRK